MMILRPIPGLTAFLQYVSESTAWKEQLDVLAYCSMVRQLSDQVLGNVMLALPPEIEVPGLVAKLLTLELKSEFKQAADRAIKQYKCTRLPVDPVTKKAEPLLTFKRGALVHFAVLQYEVAMATRLAGEATVFLPFNRGTKDGDAGNDPLRRPAGIAPGATGLDCARRG